MHSKYAVNGMCEQRVYILNDVGGDVEGCFCVICVNNLMDAHVLVGVFMKGRVGFWAGGRGPLKLGCLQSRTCVGHFEGRRSRTGRHN